MFGMCSNHSTVQYWFRESSMHNTVSNVTRTAMMQMSMRTITHLTKPVIGPYCPITEKIIGSWMPCDEEEDVDTAPLNFVSE